MTINYQDEGQFDSWLRGALADVHSSAAVPEGVLIKVTPRLGGGKGSAGGAAESQRLLPPGRHDHGYDR